MARISSGMGLQVEEVSAGRDIQREKVSLHGNCTGTERRAHTCCDLETKNAKAESAGHTCYDFEIGQPQSEAQIAGHTESVAAHHMNYQSDGSTSCAKSKLCSRKVCGHLLLEASRVLLQIQHV